MLLSSKNYLIPKIGTIKNKEDRMYAFKKLKAEEEDYVSIDKDYLIPIFDRNKEFITNSLDKKGIELGYNAIENKEGIISWKDIEQYDCTNLTIKTKYWEKFSYDVMNVESFNKTTGLDISCNTLKMLIGTYNKSKKIFDLDNGSNDLLIKITFGGFYNDTTGVYTRDDLNIKYKKHIRKLKKLEGHDIFIIENKWF